MDICNTQSPVFPRLAAIGRNLPIMKQEHGMAVFAHREALSIPGAPEGCPKRSAEPRSMRRALELQAGIDRRSRTERDCGGSKGQKGPIDRGAAKRSDVPMYRWF